jgi:hypothetical protein
VLSTNLVAVEALAADGLPQHDLSAAHVLAEMAGGRERPGSGFHAMNVKPA